MAVGAIETATWKLQADGGSQPNENRTGPNFNACPLFSIGSLVATSRSSLIAIASSKKQGIVGRRFAPSSVKLPEVLVAVVNAIE